MRHLHITGQYLGTIYIVCAGIVISDRVASLAALVAPGLPLGPVCHGARSGRLANILPVVHAALIDANEVEMASLHAEHKYDMVSIVIDKLDALDGLLCLNLLIALYEINTHVYPIGTCAHCDE